jgi:Uma2 family endonuclease
MLRSEKIRGEKQMGLPRQKPKLTSDEYLRIERAAEHRSEFYDGEMFAMAGNSPRHSLIASNITGLFWSQLRDRRCVAYDSNLRIRVPSTGLYTYGDVVVVCGPLEYDDNDDRKDTIVNPTLIVEILSPSTEAYDRGQKFDQYRELSSFREYLLVSQQEARVERRSKNSDGSWTTTVIAGQDGTVSCESVKASLPLSEIYLGIDFGAKETDPSDE